MSRKTPGKVAVFDMGNVLVRWDPRNLYTRIFATQVEMEHFLTHVCTPEWNVAQDAGRSWEEAISLATAEHPKYAAEIRAFRERWFEMIGGPIEPNVALLRDLQANGVPTYLISNVAADTLDVLTETFDFLGGFDGVVCSGTERMLKPEPEIFRLFLDRYGVKAQDCIFIDDSAANIATAKGLGFGTVHYGLGTDARSAFAQQGLAV